MANDRLAGEKGFMAPFSARREGKDDDDEMLDYIAK